MTTSDSPAHDLSVAEELIGHPTIVRTKHAERLSGYLLNIDPSTRALALAVPMVRVEIRDKLSTTTESIF